MATPRGIEYAMDPTRFANLEVTLDGPHGKRAQNAAYRLLADVAPNRMPPGSMALPNSWAEEEERTLEARLENGESEIVLRPLMYAGGVDNWWYKMGMVEVRGGNTEKGTLLTFVGCLVGRDYRPQKAPDGATSVAVGNGATFTRIRFFDGLKPTETAFAPVHMTDVDMLKVTFSRLFNADSMKDKLG